MLKCGDSRRNEMARRNVKLADRIANTYWGKACLGGGAENCLLSVFEFCWWPTSRVHCDEGMEWLCSTD